MTVKEQTAPCCDEGEASTPGAWRRVAYRLPALIGLVLLVAAIYVIQKELKSLSLSEIRQAFQAIPIEPWRQVSGVRFFPISFCLSMTGLPAIISERGSLSFGRLSRLSALMFCRIISVALRFPVLRYASGFIATGEFHPVALPRLLRSARRPICWGR